MIGIGLDVVELDRFRRTLARTPTFGRRVFTPAEDEYCRRRRDPTERYAVRFAAKEAVLKAMGSGLWSCPLTDIEVVRAASGEPSVKLHGAALELADERGIGHWMITLTHTDLLAQAIAIALEVARTVDCLARWSLTAADLGRTVEFYEDVLGFVTEGHERTKARLRLGGVVLDICQEGVEPRVQGSSGAILLEVADVERTMLRAERHRGRIEVSGVSETGTPLMQGFTVIDPDGVAIHVRAQRNRA